MPRLICAAQAADQEEVRSQLLNPIFLARKNIRHTLGISVAVCSYSCVYGLRLTKFSEEDREEVLPHVICAASVMPVQPAPDVLFAWLEHVTGGGPSVWYSRPYEFNLEGLCCAIAIVTACARKASWTPEDVQGIYDLARNQLEHNSRVLKA